MAQFEKLTAPSQGTPIRFENGQPVVADNPIIPFIRGDGTGVDIWPATQKVLDAAVAKAYGGSKSIEWFKVYAGDEACDLYGTYQYLPEDTLEAIRTYGVAIKGPLTTPVGGGIRSLNVALRQIFDLYSCVRPCRYYEGTPSPHKRPQDLDVIVYRENTEDIYMGVEWEADDAVGQELRKHLNEVVIPANGKLGKRQIPEGSGIGIKPVSKAGSQRHIRKAIQHALRLQGDKRHVTLVHKGNIMKFTEGAFRDWGYELATTEFRDVCITERESWILGNLEKDPNLSVQANARMIEPGYDSLTPEKKADIDAEVQAVKDYVTEQGSEAILSRHWELGSEGSAELATRVAEIADAGQSQFSPIYPDSLPLFEKIERIAKSIYRADEVLADAKIRNQLKDWEAQGYGNLPICMAKTQYSFSTDPNLRGAPTGHSVPVREVRLSAGAGFVVVICGEIMTMPGLPRTPAAEAIHLNADGQIEGLF